MNPLRVQHLVGYGLEVPDLAVATAFYSAFGLRAAQVGGAFELYSLRNAPPAIVVVSGPVKRLHHISFAIRAEDAERFDAHLRSLGTPLVTPPFSSIRQGWWLQDPWGTWINLAVDEPLYVPTPAPTVIEARVDRHYWSELPREIKPNRIGHMLMFTQDWEKVEAWYAKALGLVTTDRAVGKVAFMAGGSGVRDHHCFGLINDTHRGIQHSSFQVDSIDHIGLGALQMYKAGHQEGFGVGRHALASNLFHYTRDPWGSWIEYYADMDKISEAWQTRDWKEIPYIWPQWAPEFWTNEMNINHEPR